MRGGRRVRQPGGREGADFRRGGPDGGHGLRAAGGGDLRGRSVRHAPARAVPKKRVFWERLSRFRDKKKWRRSPDVSVQRHLPPLGAAARAGHRGGRSVLGRAAARARRRRPRREHRRRHRAASSALPEPPAGEEVPPVSGRAREDAGASERRRERSRFGVLRREEHRGLGPRGVDQVTGRGRRDEPRAWPTDAANLRRRGTPRGLLAGRAEQSVRRVRERRLPRARGDGCRRARA